MTPYMTIAEALAAQEALGDNEEMEDLAWDIDHDLSPYVAAAIQGLLAGRHQETESKTGDEFATNLARHAVNIAVAARVFTHTLALESASDIIANTAVESASDIIATTAVEEEGDK